ncbi:MAG: glycosyltransferase family A protein [Actinomycetes bacterium]
MPRVSVIIAAYNAEEFIREALESAWAQTYRDFEIVVSDDASTDGTAALVEVVASEISLRLVRAVRNGGTGQARNAAITESSGELLAFLDADDLWEVDFLESLVALYDEARAAGRNPGIVTCDALLLDSNGVSPSTYQASSGVPDNLTLAQLLRFNTVYGGVLVARTAVEGAGGIDPTLRGSDDYDLWIRILELGYTVVASTQPLAIYRQRHDSLSHNLGAMNASLELLYSRAIERGRLRPAELRIVKRQLRLHRAIGAVATPDGISAARTLRSLPLIAWACLENYDRMPFYVRRFVARNRTSPIA